MINRKFLSYFTKGFNLTNHSLEIYLISIIPLLFGVLTNTLNNSPFRFIFDLIYIVGVFFVIGFEMSVPLFLTFKQQGKQLNFKNIWPILKKNTKRMIAPIFLLFSLLVLFVIISFIVVAISYPNNGVEVFTGGLNSLVMARNNWNLLMIAIISLFTIFVFNPIYFSIENIGFFTSLKRSVSFSLKHLNFILLLALIYAIQYTITALLRIPVEDYLKQTLLSIITTYTALVISASTLLFYQAHKN